MLEKVIQEFNKYTHNYDMNDVQISLKYYHSFAVSDLMGELAFRLGLSKEKIEIARVIGLLHDIGRFEQVKIYHSFSDDNVDHADESVKYLFDKGHIRDFIDDNQYDNIIEKAIKYHNKYKIPDNLDEEELFFAKMIRDMDKVDIFKQLAVHREFEFNADALTPSILENFKKEECIVNSNVKTNSDKTIKYLTFIYDINFEESFDILVNTDNFDLFLSIVDVDSNSQKLWKKIRKICFDKINRGVGSNE